MIVNIKQYISEDTAAKDKHLTHLEDAVLESGVVGINSALKFLVSIRDILSDNRNEDLILRTKVDGAPAIYAGINPENGKFFIGTKSVLSKTPKINYTEQDIEHNYSGQLAERLKIALKYLPELGIKDIIHGDLMYISKDLRRKTIDGKKYITFRPNTITYAIPEDTTLANQILKSKLGIIFHTTYYGDSMNNLQTHFDVDIGKLKSSENVWYRENKFDDVDGKSRLTVKEREHLDSIISEAKKTFNNISSRVLNELSTNSVYKNLIMRFHNNQIRKNKKINTNQIDELINWIYELYENSTKNKQNERDIIIRWFRKNKSELINIFKLQTLIIEAKDLILNKLNLCKDLDTYIKSDDGKYKITTPEGYVCAWVKDKTAMKLVDRMEFSRANFLTAKDWDSETSKESKYKST